MPLSSALPSWWSWSLPPSSLPTPLPSSSSSARTRWPSSSTRMKIRQSKPSPTLLSKPPSKQTPTPKQSFNTKLRPSQFNPTLLRSKRMRPWAESWESLKILSNKRDSTRPMSPLKFPSSKVLQAKLHLKESLLCLLRLVNLFLQPLKLFQHFLVKLKRQKYKIAPFLLNNSLLFQFKIAIKIPRL